MVLILSCILSVFAGFTLRLCLEYNSETFTLRFLLLRFLITICVSIPAYYTHRDYKINMGIELYLFIVGFFAVFIVNIFDKTSQLGFRIYIKLLLKKLLAYVDTEEKQDKK